MANSKQRARLNRTVAVVVGTSGQILPSNYLTAFGNVLTAFGNRLTYGAPV